MTESADFVGVYELVDEVGLVLVQLHHFRAANKCKGFHRQIGFTKEIRHLVPKLNPHRQFVYVSSDRRNNPLVVY